MKKNILDIEVSCFKNYLTPNNPKKITLRKWLESSKYRDQVLEIRNTENKESRNKLKSLLPAITPSGLFSYRSAKSLVSHSGFLQIDIDFSDNSHITNYRDLKEELMNIENFAYVGLSVSGNGYWGLIPILYPDKHKAHFDALHKGFINLGIKIDSSCRDVCRLRGYSIDDSPYFNFDAKPFSDVVDLCPIKKRNTFSNFRNDSNSPFLYCINKIQELGIDISNGDYKIWYEIGCSIVSEYGERGLEYFTIISNQYQGEQSITPDSQYKYCLRNQNGFGIGTFFYYCKVNGISYK